MLSLVAELAVAADGSAAGRRSGATCAIETGPDSYFGSRTRIVRFPDGHTQTVIGLNHGNRDLRGGVADQLARVRSSADIARILAADPSALADASEAVRYLREVRPTFVAAEASPDTVATNLKTYSGIRSKISKLTGADDAMKMAFGADFYLRLNDDIKKLVGVEDSQLGSQYLRALPVLTKETDRLSHAKFDPDVAARMNDFVGSLVSRYVSLTDREDLMREARAKFTAQDFAKIEPFLKTRIDVMRAMKARDRHDVAQLMKQNTSGVLLIGSSHLDSIAQLLCEAYVSAAKPAPK